MRCKYRWAWAGLGIVVLLVVNPVRAQDHAPPPPPEGKVAELPRAALEMPHEGAPCVEPEAVGSWATGLFFNVDYLYVRPQRNAMDFAIVAPNTIQIPAGSIESIGWQSNSGIRFGFGYRTADAWEIGFTYTNLHNTGSTNLAAPAGGTLYATLTRANTFDDVTTASASDSLNYNVIDLEAGKHLAGGDSLDLKVFGGGRFAWIDQGLTAIYNGGSASAVNALVDVPVHFRGAGLSVGAEGWWKVYHGLGLYALGRGSILAGQFINYYTETNNNNTTVLVNVKEKYTQLVPVTDVSLGAGFQGEHLSLRVGYELTNWFSMVNSPSFPSSIGLVSRRTSDLMLEGLVVRLGLIF